MYIYACRRLLCEGAWRVFGVEHTHLVPERPCPLPSDPTPAWPASPCSLAVADRGDTPRVESCGGRTSPADAPFRCVVVVAVGCRAASASPRGITHRLHLPARPHRHPYPCVEPLARVRALAHCTDFLFIIVVCVFVRSASSTACAVALAGRRNFGRGAAGKTVWVCQRARRCCSVLAALDVPAHRSRTRAHHYKSSAWLSNATTTS
ncbi:hypothetical protein B0H15DRAFT_955799 [Mycena belliarum]|uniref:Uncharacterized protein n=1 Tax=Mycena belliarum TaxID=1033014 RepID=A0AAD6TUT2_9AGAR|nr:hypothetical protein B0H15DRAFT_955799 [Mycena belliae]